MSVVTKDYVESLPAIYRDILAAFPEVEPARNAGEGLAYQTLFAKLREQGEKGESLREMMKSQWSIGEVVEACQKMQQGGAVEIKQGIFVCPTPLGEEMITLLTGTKPREPHVPDFPHPAQA